jgi:hypothetical protein
MSGLFMPSHSKKVSGLPGDSPQGYIPASIVKYAISQDMIKDSRATKYFKQSCLTV